MAEIVKHVGRYGGNPCVVVFREVPNEPENCLIVQTNLLEARQHDDLMAVVQSLEGQEAGDISQVLARRQFTDGTNMLQTLHNSRNIAKVSVSQVMLTPTPAQEIPLSEVNAEIRMLENPQALKTDAGQTKVSTEQVEGTPANTQAEAPAEDPNVAQSLMVQAQLMKEDAEKMITEANAKIAQAEKLDPSLKKAKRSAKKATA
jgi:hypothetical protein